MRTSSSQFGPNDLFSVGSRQKPCLLSFSGCQDPSISQAFLGLYKKPCIGRTFRRLMQAETLPRSHLPLPTVMGSEPLSS